MSDTKICSKCDHELVSCFTEVDMPRKGIVVKALPQKLINKKTTIVKPFVCPNCGFTEWYADEPNNLA